MSAHSTTNPADTAAVVTDSAENNPSAGAETDTGSATMTTADMLSLYAQQATAKYWSPTYDQGFPLETGFEAVPTVIMNDIPFSMIQEENVPSASRRQKSEDGTATYIDMVEGGFGRKLYLVSRAKMGFPVVLGSEAEPMLGATTITMDEKRAALQAALKRDELRPPGPDTDGSYQIVHFLKPEGGTAVPVDADELLGWPYGFPDNEVRDHLVAMVKKSKVFSKFVITADGTPPAWLTLRMNREKAKYRTPWGELHKTPTLTASHKMAWMEKAVSNTGLVEHGQAVLCPEGIVIGSQTAEELREAEGQVRKALEVAGLSIHDDGSVSCQESVTLWGVRVKHLSTESTYLYESLQSLAPPVTSKARGNFISLAKVLKQSLAPGSDFNILQEALATLESHRSESWASAGSGGLDNLFDQAKSMLCSAMASAVPKSGDALYITTHADAASLAVVLFASRPSKPYAVFRSKLEGWQLSLSPVQRQYYAAYVATQLGMIHLEVGLWGFRSKRKVYWQPSDGRSLQLSMGPSNDDPVSRAFKDRLRVLGVEISYFDDAPVSSAQLLLSLFAGSETPEMPGGDDDGDESHASSAPLKPESASADDQGHSPDGADTDVHMTRSSTPDADRLASNLETLNLDPTISVSAKAAEEEEEDEEDEDEDEDEEDKDEQDEDEEKEDEDEEDEKSEASDSDGDGDDKENEEDSDEEL